MCVFLKMVREDDSKERRACSLFSLRMEVCVKKGKLWEYRQASLTSALWVCRSRERVREEIEKRRRLKGCSHPWCKRETMNKIVHKSRAVDPFCGWITAEMESNRKKIRYLQDFVGLVSSFAIAFHLFFAQVHWTIHAVLLTRLLVRDASSSLLLETQQRNIARTTSCVSWSKNFLLADTILPAVALECMLCLIHTLLFPRSWSPLCISKFLSKKEVGVKKEGRADCVSADTKTMHTQLLK